MEGRTANTGYIGTQLIVYVTKNTPRIELSYFDQGII